MNAWEVIGGAAVSVVAARTLIPRIPFTTRSNTTMSDPNTTPSTPPTNITAGFENLVKSKTDTAIDAGALALDTAAAGVDPALGVAVTMATNAAKPALEQFIADELPKVEAYVKAAAIAGEHFLAHALQDAESHVASFFHSHFAAKAAAAQKPAVSK